MSLGKIENIIVGMGGYDNAMFGVTYILTTQDGSVQEFDGTWLDQTGKDEKWREGQISRFGSALFRLSCFMRDAKVKNVTDLIGKPVEVTWKLDQSLSSWRILKEVL